MLPSCVQEEERVLSDKGSLAGWHQSKHLKSMCEQRQRKTPLSFSTADLVLPPSGPQGTDQRTSGHTRQLLVPHPQFTPRERGSRRLNPQTSVPVPTHRPPRFSAHPQPPQSTSRNPTHLHLRTHHSPGEAAAETFMEIRALIYWSKGRPHATATVQHLWSVTNPLQQKEKLTLKCTHPSV